MAKNIDTLNKAARAAGFAMATYDDVAPVPTPRTASLPAPIAEKSFFRHPLKADAWRSSSRALEPVAPRIVVRGSLFRHWLTGWAGKATAS